MPTQYDDRIICQKTGALFEKERSITGMNWSSAEQAEMHGQPYLTGVGLAVTGTRGSS